MTPTPDEKIRPGDELLFAGTRRALEDIELIIANEHTLEYILTGRDLPGGRIWELLAQRGRKERSPQLP